MAREPVLGCTRDVADGFITPAISVTSAVEGLQLINPEVPTVFISFAILFLLFIFQQFGSVIVRKTFGPIMTAWFIMLAVLGGYQLIQNPVVLKALNPHYAWSLVLNYPKGFVLLSAVFLCTTGAEALYSDLGQCGKENIRSSWVFVKICLLINYFGQGAWLLTERGNYLEGQIPFCDHARLVSSSRHFDCHCCRSYRQPGTHHRHILTHQRGHET